MSPLVDVQAGHAGLGLERRAPPRRSTITLFQDSRCAMMRRCNSQIGVTQPDPACLQHIARSARKIELQVAYNARPPSPHDLPLIS